MARLALVFLFGAIASYCDAAITRAKPPDGWRHVVHENTGRILRNDPRFLGRFSIDQLTISDPIPNYNVGLMDLAAGQFLASARPAGWTCLFTTQSGAPAGAAGVIEDKTSSTALRFNGLYQTNFTSETLEAMRRAEQLPQVQKSDHELRRLDCPAVHFVALWLHGRSDDIILPLPPTFGRWNAYQSYSAEQISKLLTTEAAKAR